MPYNVTTVFADGTVMDPALVLAERDAILKALDGNVEAGDITAGVVQTLHIPRPETFSYPMASTRGQLGEVHGTNHLGDAPMRWSARDRIDQFPVGMDANDHCRIPGLMRTIGVDTASILFIRAHLVVWELHEPTVAPQYPVTAGQLRLRWKDRSTGVDAACSGATDGTFVQLYMGYDPTVGNTGDRQLRTQQLRGWVDLSGLVAPTDIDVYVEYRRTSAAFGQLVFRERGMLIEMHRNP